jgi:2-iminobutanoate/2-iminopropanoate deaminase
MDNKTIVSTSNAPLPIGPYSQAVKVGQTLYVSGQIALDPVTNQLITNDISEETNQVMMNIQAVLDAAGLSFSNVVKCSIFVNDMGNFTAVNEVYGRFFPENPPARETVEVSKLPKNVNVEISCIACH